MTIKTQFQVDRHILLVKASGSDDNVDDVIHYGMSVIQKASESGCRAILCDEIDLRYTIDRADTYQEASFIAENAPHVAWVALVVHPERAKEAHFWETVVVNRGLVARVFESVARARAWLEAAAPAHAGARAVDRREDLPPT